LQVAPYYNKPTQEGMFQHFKAIAEDVGLPICVYNIPGRTGKNIEPETIARLSELPNITMVKEATGSLDQCSQILNSTDLTVLSGDDSLTLPMMSVGAEGVISVAGNIVPKDLLAMINAANANDLSEARRWHHRLFPLCRDMLGLSTNPIPIKAAMRLLGRDTGQLRLPMTPLDADQESQLRKTLSNYGLL
jgi:4-hydroxy-tetrahydrodipicolinate synthase